MCGGIPPVEWAVEESSRRAFSEFDLSIFACAAIEFNNRCGSGFSGAAACHWASADFAASVSPFAIKPSAFFVTPSGRAPM